MTGQIVHFPANVSRRNTQITPAKMESFLSKLDIRVFKWNKELSVLSVYLDDDGHICVDVEEEVVPQTKTGVQ